MRLPLGFFVTHRSLNNCIWTESVEDPLFLYFAASTQDFCTVGFMEQFDHVPFKRSQNLLCVRTISNRNLHKRSISICLTVLKSTHVCASLKGTPGNCGCANARSTKYLHGWEVWRQAGFLADIGCIESLGEGMRQGRRLQGWRVAHCVGRSPKDVRRAID